MKLNIGIQDDFMGFSQCYQLSKHGVLIGGLKIVVVVISNKTFNMLLLERLH